MRELAGVEVDAVLGDLVEVQVVVWVVVGPVGEAAAATAAAAGAASAAAEAAAAAAVAPTATSPTLVFASVRSGAGVGRVGEF